MIVKLELKGLTCEHCAASVREELEEIAGVKDVNVQVVKGGTSIATLEATQELADNAIQDAINEAGYELVSVD